MQGIAMIWRAGLRRGWGATVALIALVGIGGGVVLAGAAGASRTRTAMSRFVAFSHPEDLAAVAAQPDADPSDPAVAARIISDRVRLAHLPSVTKVARAPYMFMAPDPEGKEIGAINPFAAADANAFRTVDRPLIVAGRQSRLDRADEAVVDDLTAATRHLRLGSVVTMWSFTPDQEQAAFASGFSTTPKPAGPVYRFHIVGIARTADTVNAPPAFVVRNANFEGQGGMFLTPAFLARFADDHGVPVEALPGMEVFRVSLRRGAADVARFRKESAGLVHPEDLHPGSDIQAAADKVGGAIHLEAVALVIFAVLSGLAATVLVSQALARQVAAETREHAALSALGLSRRHLLLVPLLRTAVSAVAGAGLAVLVAIALSPLTPIGLARRAEVHPGATVNVAVLTIGFVATVAGVILLALPRAWRAAATADRPLEQAPARPGLVTAALTGSGIGPAAVAGVGMSLERGRGMAFRASLVGTVAAVAGVIGALTFGASLHQLVQSPRQQGWNWDVVVGNPNNAQAYEGDPALDPVHRAVVEGLRANRYVAAFAGLSITDGVSVGGRIVSVVGVEPGTGSVFLHVIEGREPAAADEIVLGQQAARRLPHGIGDSVVMAAGGAKAKMRVVGIVLQPTGGDMSTKLDGGAAVTIDGLRRVTPQAGVVQFAVRLRPGVDRRAATRSLLDQFGRQLLVFFPGGEVGDLAKVDFLPSVLAWLLVTLAVAALGLALGGSVRRHRRDLAVLKTIGFSRRQVSATVAWQATLLALAAGVIGVPIGLVVGRTSWRLVAAGIGSVSPLVVPATALLLAIPATIVIANLLAVGPGWAAGRVPPAEALRAE